MTSTYNGISSSESWENLRRSGADGGAGAGTTERLITGLAGVALIVLAVRRKRLRGILLPLGGSLLSRAVIGRPALRRGFGRKTAAGDRVSPVASVARGQGLRVEQSVMIDRPAEEVYRFWRQLDNLPRFMDHLEAVVVIDEDRSHWTAKGPGGTKVEWDAEIHNEIENELLAWRSLPSSDVDHAGSVHFTPLGDSTEVRVVLSYDPPAGRAGVAVAKLLGEEPGQQVKDDLRRFKQVMEAGGAPAKSRRPAGRG